MSASRTPLHCPAEFAFLTLLVLCVPPKVCAQGGLFDEYTVQPEVWHFAVPKMPGVDGQGNLNLSIPVMTVPGRGLDFDITFSYRSGITARQRPSWIGLGWSFDPGSITREPGGNAASWNDHMGRYVSYGVDVFDDAQAPPALPDTYYLTLPGRGTVEVTQINGAAYARPNLLPAALEGDFVVNDFQPWRIAYEMSNGAIDLGGDCLEGGTGCPTGEIITPSEGFDARPDIERFVVTTEDGTRYIFEAPTLAYFDHYVRGNNSRGIVRQVYVNAWRLVAILGPSYVGNGLPTVGDAGSWVRLKYGAVQYDDLSHGIGGVAKFAQTRFLQEIITPTHCAVFSTGERDGPFFADHEDEIQRHLRRITLYDAPRCGAGGRQIQKDLLDQSKGLEGHSPEKHPPNGLRRLRLDGIRFKGEGGQVRGGKYTFTYDASASDLLADPASLESNTDDFGYYSPGFGAQQVDAEHGGAWSLTKITYPTGGWAEIDYETDHVDGTERVKYMIYTGDVYYYFNAAAYLRYQGGARVKEIRRSDGMGQEEVIRFTYGEGYSSGVPPLYWPRRRGGNVRLYTPSNRGKVGVFYAWVKKELAPQGGATKTYYTTSERTGIVEIEAYRYQETYLNQQRHNEYCQYHADCHIITAIQDNRHWNWGRLYRTEYLGSNGGVVKRIERNVLALPQGRELAQIWTDELACSVDCDEGGPPPFFMGVQFGESHVGSTVVYEKSNLIQRAIYTYDPRTGLRKAKEVRDGANHILREQTWAFAHDRYAGMRARNMLSQPYATTVTDKHGDVRSKHWTTWRNNSYGYWAPAAQVGAH